MMENGETIYSMAKELNHGQMEQNIRFFKFCIYNFFRDLTN